MQTQGGYLLIEYVIYSLLGMILLSLLSSITLQELKIINKLWAKEYTIITNLQFYLLIQNNLSCPHDYTRRYISIKTNLNNMTLINLECYAKEAKKLTRKIYLASSEPHKLYIKDNNKAASSYLQHVYAWELKIKEDEKSDKKILRITPKVCIPKSSSCSKLPMLFAL